MPIKTEQQFMMMAIQMAKKGMDSNEGGPFGAVVVDSRGGIVGRGYNKVTSTNDPTAHAEIVAIRDACTQLGSFQLEGCTIYTSCEPCPMCLGAIYWARPETIIFACSREDAAKVGFDDEHIYKEIRMAIKDRKIPTRQILRKEANEIFRDWEAKNDKLTY